ncbi:hypothetical protein BI364_10290 [Acidihalobacter yilgarnensis]|uniref:Hemerythrin-like domain-containing protein n=1 Tax=Acidihalobacter yilgarnensis TaxID=2819280 RepID=A0A1D8IP92_9GAMM|nr:hypothetical protein [Acidihalobacter yilgarnensis]AOU98297.1 hypothetical protein BI364_10290 [Acidihalobacter yilgarnensis]
MPQHLIDALTHEHQAMLQAMQRLRLALLDGDINSAHEARDVLQRLHVAHIAAEETELIPQLPAAARWQAKVYLAEHAKLAAMIEQWHERLQQHGAHIDSSVLRLALLDASLPLQHLLEHHFEREEKGLFLETAT